MIKMKIDPVSLTADLVRCPSVTPEEGGAIDLLEQLLEKNGFYTGKPNKKHNVVSANEISILAQSEGSEIKDLHVETQYRCFNDIASSMKLCFCDY